jgi:hypothetical protein
MVGVCFHAGPRYSRRSQVANRRPSAGWLGRSLIRSISGSSRSMPWNSSWSRRGDLIEEREPWQRPSAAPEAKIRSTTTGAVTAGPGRSRSAGSQMAAATGSPSRQDQDRGQGQAPRQARRARRGRPHPRQLHRRAVPEGLAGDPEHAGRKHCHGLPDHGRAPSRADRQCQGR